MNKYIRTKNMIYQVESILRDNGFVKGYNVGEMAFIKKEQVIKQADTIEELCDYFLIDKNDIEHYEPTTLLIFDDYDDFRYSMFGYENSSGYGCIKTDKGLIFVSEFKDKDMVLI